MKILFYLSSLIIINTASCNNKKELTTTPTNNTPIQTQRNDGLQNAYFASGCFWCVEAIFESIKGVKEVVSGYAGGTTKNPTYEQVGSGNTGHAETVEVQYDPKIITFETLIKAYYGSQNPTSYGQSPDFGSAYRSVIFYQNDTEKNIITTFKKNLQKKYSEKVRTEIVPFEAFWKAEDYHQDFEKLNPNYPYVVRISKPRLERFKEKFPELIKN